LIDFSTLKPFLRYFFTFITQSDKFTPVEVANLSSESESFISLSFTTYILMIAKDDTLCMLKIVYYNSGEGKKKEKMIQITKKTN
jgi:hypothetical protein